MRKTRARAGEKKSLGDPVAHAFNITTATIESERRRLPAWWRGAGYGATVLAFAVLVVFAWLCPDFNRPATSDWKSVLALANASRESGDTNEARHLYVQVERIAVWQQDWEGLVAAACGIKRLDGAPAPYAKVYQILFRAFVAAQNRQSRRGIATVAKAFTSLAEHKAAEMVLAHARADWPAETEAPDESLLDGCGTVP